MLRKLSLKRPIASFTTIYELFARSTSSQTSPGVLLGRSTWLLLSSVSTNLKCLYLLSGLKICAGSSLTLQFQTADKILDLRDRQGEGGRTRFSSQQYINTQQRGSLWGLTVLPSTCLAAWQLSDTVSSLQIYQDRTGACILRILTWWHCHKTKQEAVNQMIAGQFIKNTVIWLLEESDCSHANIQTQMEFSRQINQSWGFGVKII